MGSRGPLFSDCHHVHYPVFGNGIEQCLFITDNNSGKGANGRIPGPCLSIKAYVRECQQSYMQSGILIPFTTFPEHRRALFCDSATEPPTAWSAAR